MPNKTPNPSRKSIRLQDYDYSQPGVYFVTVCTKDRKCLFGTIQNGEMKLNNMGDTIMDAWINLPRRFSNIEMDYFVIMPNHIHGIIRIVGAGLPRPAQPNASSGAETAPLPYATLGQMIAFFKYASTKQINALRQMPGRSMWQRNYYEHIIRSESKLNQIRQYILGNPTQWDQDENNLFHRPVVDTSVRMPI